MSYLVKGISHLTLRIIAFTFVSHHKESTNQVFLAKLIKSEAQLKVRVVKSSCLIVFCKNAFLKNFASFIRNYLRWILFLGQVAGLVLVNLLKTFRATNCLNASKLLLLNYQLFIHVF